MEKMSRRSFFKIAGVTAASSTVAAGAAAQGLVGNAPLPAPAVPQYDAYVFLNPEEARIVRAAVARLIPEDDNGPGALEADVPTFIDRQLAGAWGAGERLYRSGPWQEGDETQGYQLPFTPAELFRKALRGVRADLVHRGMRPFDEMTEADQDRYLKDLEANRIVLDGIPGKVFFESLLSLTMEGYFSDPVYGGNKDMASWKMIGFPGAYASFYDLVDQYGVLYTRPPISMGDDGKGKIHFHAAKPGPVSKGGK